MGLYFITFRSVTYAQRGEKVLAKANIRANLMRTPRWMEEQGCGYALKLWTNDIRVPLKLLREHNVQYRRIYMQKEDGTMEEAAL